MATGTTRTPPARRVPGFAFALAVALVGWLAQVPFDVGAAAAGGHVATRQHYRVVGFVRQLPRGARVSSTTSVHLDLELAPQHATELAAFASSVSDPTSPRYHHFLTPEQFRSRFAPSAREIATVRDWAMTAGLTPTTLDGSVALSGDAASFDAALDTNIVSSSSGLSTTSVPSLPATVARDVTEISSTALPEPQPLALLRGPSTKHTGAHEILAGATTTAHLAQAGGNTEPIANGNLPSACSASIAATTRVSGLTMDVSGAHYGLSALQSQGYLGSGVTVGIYEPATFSMADVDAFERCMGISTPVTVVQSYVNPCDGCAYQSLPGGGGDSLEAELDIEQVLTQAPEANVVVYEGYYWPTDWSSITSGVTVNGTTITISKDGTTSDTADDLGVYFPPPKIVTTSWGFFDSQASEFDIPSVYEQYYEQAAAEGQTILAASGDSDDAETMYPADSPEITAVGGTTISGSDQSGTDTAGASDVAWSSSTGGYSNLFSEPSWQSGVVTEPDPSDPVRAVPDVALDAGTPQMVFDSNLESMGADADQLSSSTTGSVAFTDSANDVSGCTSTTPTTQQPNWFSCGASALATGDTLTVVFSGDGTYAPSSETVVDSAGTTPSSISLGYNNGLLFASVSPLTQTSFGAQNGIDFEGSVSFADTNGEITGCSSVPVEAEGIAICDAPSLTSLDASADTLTASYSGDTNFGSSSASSTLLGDESTGDLTTINLLYATSGTGSPEYQAYVQGLASAWWWPWWGVDGTSAAAPMLAGFLADVTNTCSSSIGDLAPTIDALYAKYGSSLYGSLLTDVTSGSNPTTGYTATTGWDPVTGIGIPEPSEMACPTVTSITTSSGSPVSSGYGGEDVVLHGSNLAAASFHFGSSQATVLSQSADSASVVVPTGSGSVAVTPSVLASGSGPAFVYAVAPRFSSASSYAFSVGLHGAFTFTTSGTPVPSLSESGALPSGVGFVDNGNGTATVSGTPASGSAGSYPISVFAENGSQVQGAQSFDLFVDQSPSISMAPSATFTVGSTGDFNVSAAGYPTPSFSESGALPSGLGFVDHGNGTATIGGTPQSGSAGQYPITITARSTAGSASATLSLTTSDPPANPQTSSPTPAAPAPPIAAVSSPPPSSSAGSSSTTKRPSPSTSLLRTSTVTAEANGSSDATITVVLRTDAHAIVSNKRVTLRSSGHAVIRPESATTNGEGVATFKVSDDSAETVTLFATDATDGMRLVRSVKVAFTSVVSSTRSSIAVSSSTVPVSCPTKPDHVVVTVTLRSTNNSLVKGRTVVVKAPAGFKGSSTPTQAVTAADGKATFSISDHAAQTVSLGINDTSDAVALSYAHLTFLRRSC